MSDIDDLIAFQELITKEREYMKAFLLSLKNKNRKWVVNPNLEAEMKQAAENKLMEIRGSKTQQ